MMRRFLVAGLAVLTVSACAPSGGMMVSDKARALGGNLFVETTGDGQAQFLVLDGEITPETAAVFERVTIDAEVDGLVIAQSPGGSLLASHQIGRTIKADRMNTIILVNCISACVDIFVAGRSREMTEIAELGLHAATDTTISYEIDRRYWREMGFPELNEAAYRVPNDSLWIIDAVQAKRMGVATNILSARR